MQQKSRYILFLAVAVFALGIDQLTKYIFFSEKFADKKIIGDIVRFVVHHNYGISFNIPIPRSIILIITGTILFGILYILQRKQKISHMTIFAIALIFGGALGNMLDRIFLSYVRDWLLLFGRSAINFADISILTGITLYLFSDAHVTKDHRENA